MRDCSSCNDRPNPGESYEDTPCATCSLITDQYTASCGSVHFEDWMIPPPMEPEQTSTEAQIVITYVLSNPVQRSEMYESGGRIQQVINRYHHAFSLAERRVFTAMVRLGLQNRNVFSWLADNTSASKQYYHKVWKQMRDRIIKLYKTEEE